MQNEKVVVVMPAYNAGRTLRMTYEGPVSYTHLTLPTIYSV